MGILKIDFGDVFIFFVSFGLFILSFCAFPGTGDAQSSDELITLPAPRFSSPVSLEETLLKRRSIRSYIDTPLTLNELSQILWAAQGVTHERGLRTAPSGGATYPLEVYVVAGNVDGLKSGVYRYLPKDHALLREHEGDKRIPLKDCTLNQNFVADAPASLVFFAVFERITKKYGDRGVRYAYMEAGHAAQNVCLQGVALGIDTVVVGAFTDEKVKELISTAPAENPMYIIPLGKRKAQ